MPPKQVQAINSSRSLRLGSLGSGGPGRVIGSVNVSDDESYEIKYLRDLTKNTDKKCERVDIATPDSTSN
jgi:hypothetical protein